MMKYVLAAVASTMLLMGPVHADESPAIKVERFYGKIISADATSRSLSVFNRKRNQETQFTWDRDTTFVENKTPIDPDKLAIGQYVMVSFIPDANLNKAKKIVVRPVPFRKKSQP